MNTNMKKKMSVMKHINLKKFCLFLAIGVMGVLTTGCIRDSLDACPPVRVEKVEHKLLVQALNYEHYVVSEEVPADVYIFDASGKLLENFKLTGAQVAAMGGEDAVAHAAAIPLNYPAGTKLQIAVYGNMGSNEVLTKSDRLENMKVSLAARSNNTRENPSELHHGLTAITLEDVDTKATGEIIEETVVKYYQATMRPLTSKATITTWNFDANRIAKGLKADDVVDFELELNDTYSEYDYTGALKTKGIDMNPESGYGAYTNRDEGKTQEEWRTNYENYFPDQGFSVKIAYPDGEVIKAETDINGVPLLLGQEDGMPDGNMYDFVIEFDGETGEFVGVRVKVRKWGEIDDPIEW